MIDLDNILSRIQTDPAAEEELTLALQQALMGGEPPSESVADIGGAETPPANSGSPDSGFSTTFSQSPPAQSQSTTSSNSTEQAETSTLNEDDPTINPSTETTDATPNRATPNIVQEDDMMALAEGMPNTPAQSNQNLNELIRAVIAGEIADENQLKAQFSPEAIKQFLELPPEVLEALKTLAEKNFQNT